MAHMVFNEMPRFPPIDPVFSLMELTPRWNKIFRKMLRNRRALERNGSVHNKYGRKGSGPPCFVLKVRKRGNGRVRQCSIYIGKHEALADLVKKTMKYWRTARKRRARMRQEMAASRAAEERNAQREVQDESGSQQ